MFKGAVFDLDGTLVDTEAFCLRSWTEALKPFGIEFTEKDYMDFVGKTRTIIAPGIIKKYGLDMGADALLKTRKDVLARFLRTEPIRIMPFAEEAVQYFIGRNTPVALATGSSMDETQTKLERTGLGRFFRTIVTRDDVVNGKPHMETYDKITKMLGIEPKACITFEDTLAGVQSAKRTGLACVAIPNALTKHQDFSIADFVAKDLQEAIEWVKKR